MGSESSSAYFQGPYTPFSGIKGGLHTHSHLTSLKEIRFFSLLGSKIVSLSGDVGQNQYPKMNWVHKVYLLLE